jgi:hypothetical protein
MAIRKEDTEKNERAVVRDGRGNITKVIDFSNKQVGLPENPKNLTVTGASLGSSQFVPMLAGGRLTLASSVPVTTASIVSASVVYYTPMDSNQLTLHNGTFWQQCSFTQPSFKLTSDNPANTNYDVFASISPSADEVVLNSLAWSGANTRQTALTRKDGVLVSAADNTWRYLGTIRTTAAGVTEDSFTRRLVWNRYNRVLRPMTVREVATSWIYSTATYRLVNANGANRFEVVVGDDGIHVNATAHTMYAASSGIVAANGGIGIDSVTSSSANTYGGYNTVGSSVMTAEDTQLRAYLTPGFHQINWLEIGNTNITFYGTNGTPANYQAGMVGEISG